MTQSEDAGREGKDQGSPPAGEAGETRGSSDARRRYLKQ